MRHFISIISLFLATLCVEAQTLNVNIGSVTYQFPASQTGDMYYSDGSSLTIMGKVFSLAEVTNMTVDDAEVTDNNVKVTYNGTSAHVYVAGNVARYLTPTVSGAHVSLVQSDSVQDNVGEITYVLSGTTTDGEFYLSGSYKSTVELNGVSITNATPVFSGAAIHVQNGKRINIRVATGTENTLTDASGGSQKACLYVKGHAEFKQKGTLNIYGNTGHGIKTGEYMTVKNCTINVRSAQGDGIHCNQYFLMESGALNISGTSDDGLQCELDGTASTGETSGHEAEDSGNIYISGGTLGMTITGTAAKGLKSTGNLVVSDGNITISTSGGGTWDSDDQDTKAASCIASDANVTISGGTLNLTSTGAGGKGLKCDSVLTVGGGSITVKTSGGKYSYGRNYYSSPKGIKAGLKTSAGSRSYTYAGGIVINGGTISVTTSGTNAEGIESKNTLEITGGEVTVEAYDDAINSGQDMTISGGRVYARGTNNDGLDSNGNCYIKGGLVYAIGSRSPEVAVDANSEEQKKLYVSGGTLVAIGGLESGSSLTQSCYSVSSWSANRWYALTTGGSTFAFLTPASAGSTLVVSGSTTPTLKSGVTVSSGTEVFGGKGYVNAAVTGGSSVSLSSYSSGNGGHGGRQGGR